MLSKVKIVQRNYAPFPSKFCPPSTKIVCPVIDSASIKNLTASAISSGFGIFSSGIFPAKSRTTKFGFFGGGKIEPGATALTRIRGASSSAANFVSSSNAFCSEDMANKFHRSRERVDLTNL